MISSPAAICLCMQYAPGGTLRDILDTQGALSEPRARRYFQQMCGALHYCHNTMHIVHRDLKLDNMLIDNHDRILLVDFGFAEYVGPSNKRLSSSAALHTTRRPRPSCSRSILARVPTCGRSASTIHDAEGSSPSRQRVWSSSARR